jgi:CubicO group peptidase (beta-lactamase class C family)/dienelactone hydrolase
MNIANIAYNDELLDGPVETAPIPLSEPLRGLPRSTPEAQGVASEGIREFIVAANRVVKTMHSFMLLRHGYVVAEAWWKPESAEKPHVMWSLSKSFTSTAIGIAVEEGVLSIDDLVVDFFPEHVPTDASNYLKAMRVRDLLTMATGHVSEAKIVPDQSWIKTFLEHPVPFKPGTHFLYNSPASYTLSAILQKLTGQTLLDYLRPRLFEPLGIENPQWETSPDGVSLGGWGLWIKTEDIAKFGQLFLQKGMWNGQQLVPVAWVELATSKQMSNGSNPDSDWDQGYGFQFWRSRHHAYRGDGRDGQFCVVLSELDAVVVMTAETADLQGQLGLVWEKLLPAFHAAPLPIDAVEEDALQMTIAGLEVSPSSVNKAAAPDPEVLPLWPDHVPGESGEIGEEHDTTSESDGLVAGKRVARIGNVSQPTITVYKPVAAKDTGAAVVVCPGGGYSILAMDLEGTEVCQWLNSIGVTAVLLKYRVPSREGVAKHAAAFQDAQRALGLVQANAQRWGVDAGRIGVLGFSAGGHLAATLNSDAGERRYTAIDEADGLSCRPDFAVLVYPAYLGELEKPVRGAPTFLVTAFDDPLVSATGVMAYAGQLREAGVPVEAHFYPSGGHGFGLRESPHFASSWPTRVGDWMRSLGLLGEHRS